MAEDLELFAELWFPQSKREAMKKLLLYILRLRLESWPLRSLQRLAARRAMMAMALTQVIDLTDSELTREELVEQFVGHYEARLDGFYFHNLAALIDARFLARFDRLTRQRADSRTDNTQ
jgi:hypothetical protein